MSDSELSIVRWMGLSILKLNPDKRGALLVGDLTNQGCGTHLLLDSIAVSLKDQVHRLGIFFNLAWFDLSSYMLNITSCAPFLKGNHND